MKTLLIAIGCLAAGAVEARTLVPARLAPSPWLDTEVSTNVPCAFDVAALKTFEMGLELVATPSNNVVVAAGRDADGDGRLSLGERALELACDCGLWTVRGEGGEIAPEVEGPDSNGVTRATLKVVLRRRKAKPSWLYGRDWDTLCLTARGVDAPQERVSFETTTTGFMFMVK